MECLSAYGKKVYGKKKRSVPEYSETNIFLNGCEAWALNIVVEVRGGAYIMFESNVWCKNYERNPSSNQKCVGVTNGIIQRAEEGLLKWFLAFREVGSEKDDQKAV